MDWKYKNIEDLKTKARNRALEFITERYELSEQQVEQLRSVRVRWTRGRRSSCRWNNTTGETYLHITVIDRPWRTYRRTSVGWTTGDEGIKLPRLLRLTLCLIHEYTHVIQRGVCGHRKRKFSEVETTMNELAYVREYAGWVLPKLKKIEGKTSRRNKAIATPKKSITKDSDTDQTERGRR